LDVDCQCREAVLREGLTVSDGRTNWTRQQARDAWARSGLTYDALTPERLERLRTLLDAEMQGGEYLRGTFRANHKPKRLRCGSYAIRCTAWYFKGHQARQCITFEPSGFIGFAGWSDDTNIQPIIRAFMAWVDEIKPTAMAA
jgi:hypothetical protein